MANFSITRGNTRTLYVDVTVAGVPLNLAGYIAWFTAKNSPTDLDTAAAIRKGTTLGADVAIMLNPLTNVSNRIKILLAVADTSGLPARETSLFYDVKIASPAGDRFTVTEGRMLVTPDVTNATA